VTDTHATNGNTARPPLSIGGHEVGAFTLLVGLEDADMRQWLPPSGAAFERQNGCFGVMDVLLSRVRRFGHGLALEHLGDSLHPSKHDALVTSLRALGVPVIATTHAPDLVDCATFEEVLVCQGDTVRRLSDHPQSAKWRRLIRAGEFWNTVGEEWTTR